MNRGDRTYTAGTKRDNQDALSWAQLPGTALFGDSPGCSRVCSPTVHRAVITLNETNICGGLEDGTPPPSVPAALENAASPGQGGTEGKHRCSWSGSSLGIQAQLLLGDTDSTQRKISFIKGLRTPLLCCLQSLVISEGHHKRGTLMQLNPKARKSMGKGRHSQPEETFSFRNKCSVLGLLCPAFTAQGNLEFPTDYTGILHLAECRELQNCPFPDPGVPSPQL